jgi:hypothetical protein
MLHNLGDSYANLPRSALILPARGHEENSRKTQSGCRNNKFS